MKTLDLNQMEKLTGWELTDWEIGCVIAGVTMGIINPFLGIGYSLWCASVS